MARSTEEFVSMPLCGQNGGARNKITLALSSPVACSNASITRKPNARLSSLPYLFNVSAIIAAVSTPLLRTLPQILFEKQDFHLMPDRTDRNADSGTVFGKSGVQFIRHFPDGFLGCTAQYRQHLRNGAFVQESVEIQMRHFRCLDIVEVFAVPLLESG